MSSGSKLKSGVLAGAVMCAFLLSSCAPNGAMTRKGNTGADRFQYDSGEEEFIYNNDHDNTARGRDDNVYDRGRVRSEGRQYRERSEPERYDDVRGYNRSSDRMNADGYNNMGDEQFFSQNPRIQSDIPEKRDSFYQKGNASWYGREFHGRLTASGERFDMKQYTAAHRSLPFGTVVLVENLDNGRKVKVKINDRGPFKKDRILDVSHVAAAELGMLKTGEAMVGITVLGKKDNRDNLEQHRRPDEVEPVFGRDSYNASDHMDSVSSPYQIQVGAFYSQVNADKLRDEVSSMFNKPVIVVREGYLYKVRITNLKSKYEAEDFKRDLQARDIPSYLVEERR